jgi:hypothetical protein
MSFGHFVLFWWQDSADDIAALSFPSLSASALPLAMLREEGQFAH